jgi:L,D-peptidoglycan transpeptidase YkuD (ErfK/YbiS/YcfS/YnhG family)
MRNVLVGFMFLLLPIRAIDAPAGCRQLVLGEAKDWNSSHVTITLYQKNGSAWKKSIAPWQGRLGKKGLAWGLGLHSTPKNATPKREGDMRTPAGLFRIGGAWGYDAKIARIAALPYRQITSRDLWVEDAASPSYNQHIILNREPTSAWEKQQQMKQNDAAHALKLFIAHNPPPKAKSGQGSSIFFHIWRNAGASATAGCTTMSDLHLRTMIAKIDPSLQPCYLILPEAEMAEIRSDWKLP